jgi:hypothetical protein
MHIFNNPGNAEYKDSYLNTTRAFAQFNLAYPFYIFPSNWYHFSGTSILVNTLFKYYFQPEYHVIKFAQFEWCVFLQNGLPLAENHVIFLGFLHLLAPYFTHFAGGLIQGKLYREAQGPLRAGIGATEA